jgi:hypothetical protein
MCGGGGSPPCPPAPGGSSPPGGTAQCDHIRVVEVCEVYEQSDGKTVRGPVASRNQFINLDHENGHKEKGRKLRFIARVQWASGSQASLAGQTVYWYAVPGGGNRAGLTGALRAGFGSSGSGTMRTSISVKSDGWTNIVEFYLSQYGGDTFQVFATENAAYTGGMPAGTFTVWRRLSYELDCMTRPGGGGTYSNRADTATMESQFRGVFVELVRSGTDASPAHRRVLTDAAAPAWTTAVRNGTGSPRYFHLVLVDTIAVSPTNQTATVAMPAGANRIELPGTTFTLDSANWFVSATYTQGTSSGAIAAASLTLGETGDPSTGDDKFTITVNTGSIGVDTTKPWSLTITFIKWTSLSGLQTGPATILGMRWRERLHRASAANLGNSTLNTMMHEPAHAMGLASQKLPTGTNNPTYYMIPGGPHCNALSNGCLMYEANSTSTALCPNCTDSIRGRNLSSLPVYGTSPY